MSDVERLQALLDSGDLLHPVSGALSIVDLANALHSVMGVPDISISEEAAVLRGKIGDPEHLVLVMADGFGMNFVEGLDRQSFVRSHLAAEMRTVFPSTTPIVLTTLATGEWPSEHSVIGWFLNLARIDGVSTIISYVRTSDRKPLGELGIRIKDAYPVESRIGRTGRAAIHLMPEQLTDTAYSNYWTGADSQVGYDTEYPHEAIQKAITSIRKAKGPTCVYLYLPHVDNLAHKLGASHERTLQAAKLVDRLLEELADALPPDARLVMTADHGHLDAPQDKTYSLAKDDKILSRCVALTGDQRAVYAHVADEDFGAFKEAVREKCGDDFLVLKSEQVEDMHLLGPEPVSRETRARMGNALVLSTGEAVLDYRAALGDELHPMASHHGGLTPAEMRIPLVLA